MTRKPGTTITRKGYGPPENEKGNPLIKLGNATRMLAEVRDASEAKTLMDIAAAAEHYATKAKLGQEAIDYAHAIKIDAQRMLGGFLKQAPKSPGPGRGKRGTREVPLLSPPLAALGLTKKESSTSQLLDTIAKEVPQEFTAIRAGKKTVTAVRRTVKRAVAAKAAKLPDAKFRIIYADPPWKYGDQLTESYGPTKFHYPAMSVTELCALPVEQLCSPDAVLFLWVTSPMLEAAFLVIKAWGFRYKSSFVWDKVKHNMGHYNSVRHEFLLVCTRGSCTPDNPKLYDSVQCIERSGHSEKPEQFRGIIDALYPHGKRIELFARKQTEGWSAYGNQAG